MINGFVALMLRVEGLLEFLWGRLKYHEIASGDGGDSRWVHKNGPVTQ